MRHAFATTAALLVLTLGACRSVPRSSREAATSPSATRYVLLLSGNRAGEAVTRVEPGGERVYTFEFNDRGRGPKTTSRVRLDQRGIPTWLETIGHDYLKVPVAERYERVGNRASWKNTSEQEERAVEGPAFYLGLSSAPQEMELLARALLDAPDGRLPLLPAGEARISRTGSAEVKAGGAGRTVHLYSIEGLGFTPVYVWLDDRRDLFASHGGWFSLIREGWEDAVAELANVQNAAQAARFKDLAARLARKPAGPLAITDARLFDPETGATFSDSTVVVSGNRVVAVGRDGEVPVPAGAEVVDARGRMLLPGLWDMHQHFSENDGILDLAAGVTSGRDLANDTDQLLAMRRRWDSGKAIGPRVVMAGFIDGPGPFAGPSKVLVDTEEEALAAVDRYAELGYVQVKLYSSLDPKLVPAIVARAHERGLRVSGHIPNGMTAEQAVRQGFDEIQHVNFLVLNFLAGVDTRTPARFSAVAEQAAELDLGSREVRDFIALLKERNTVVDPTVGAFEAMFTGGPGVMDPGLAVVADRLPPQVRRGLFGGGLPVAEGMEQRYRDSYRKMLDFVSALHEAGITLVAGTDALAGFGLHREMELYVEAGLPAADVLRIATLNAARVAGRDKDLGTIAPGKLADLILVDGDPAARISDIRRVVLTVKDGVIYDPAALYLALGVRPAVE
jgi:imidazolonepropionase-like amidohydrolase